jgi:ATPase subunit of ABC transporter with duplicated ATPase domains
MSSIVIARDISYELPDGRELFKRLNFSLGARLAALVGPNGVGKTCLARLIVGDLEPSGGSIRRGGSVKLFSQRHEPDPITVAEFLAVEYTWSLLGDRLLGNIDRHAMCSTLSGGEWMRVRLACALQDHFIILDEPTNDLDREGRRLVGQFLQDRNGGALLVSHDRECLTLCEEIFELSNRGLDKFGGGWPAYTEAKSRERERLTAALDLAKRERDAARAHETDKRTRREGRNRHGAVSAARGGMPKILLGARKSRAQSTSGKLDRAATERAVDAVRAAQEALGEMKTDPVMYADLVGREIPPQMLIAEASDFNVRFQDWVYEKDLNFIWRGNARIALNGANGSGKSTLLRALLGEVSETRGRLRRGNLVTLYLDQRCSFLDDNQSILDNVRAVSSASECEIRNGLATLLFTGASVFQLVGDLSGGERLRAALARGLLSTQKPQLLMLDEPTNNLDLANVRFLEQLMGGFRGALIVISHDVEFLKNCNVTRELVIPSSHSAAAEAPSTK